MRWAGLVLLAACSGSSEPETPPVPAPVAAPAPAPQPELVPPTSGRFAASHILIDHSGAVGSTSSRSLEEARMLAASLHDQAVAGADFTALAQEHSADSSGARGGTLGVFAAGTMMPTFEAAVASVEPGAIAPVVETPYGVHVIRRDAVTEGRFRHIVVGYAGAEGSSATRSDTEATALIQAAQARLEAGEAWADVAREVSEDALAPSAGDLGIVAPGQMVPGFDDAAFALEPGQRTGPVRTAYGVHLIERY